MKLSVVVTVFNEEEKIAECLNSVKKLNCEIVVIDNGSTDQTVKIAQKFTNKIFTQKNDPQNIDLQKNFGFTKATGDYILSLDADEYLSDNLREEIKLILSKDQTKEGYFIPRKNIVFRKWMQHTGWYPDFQLRLFKKGKAKYVSKHVHESMQILGETGNLQNPLTHENYQTVSQFIKRNLLVYAPNEADALIENGYKFSYFDVVRFPAKEFLSRFFAREGYKDGFHGLVLSLLLSSYHLAIFSYIWEKKKYADETDSSFLSKLKTEIKKIYHEFTYWFNSEKIKNEKNPVKKILLKTLRKIS